MKMTELYSYKNDDDESWFIWENTFTISTKSAPKYDGTLQLSVEKVNWLPLALRTISLIDGNPQSPYEGTIRGSEERINKILLHLVCQSYGRWRTFIIHAKFGQTSPLSELFESSYSSSTRASVQGDMTNAMTSHATRNVPQLWRGTSPMRDGSTRKPCYTREI